MALLISGDGIFRTSAGAAAPGKHPPGGGQPRPPIEIIADRNGDKIFDNLATRLSGKPDDILFDVIVQFTLPLASVDFPGLQRAIGPFAQRSSYHSINAIATTWSNGQIRAASRVPFVKQIELDGLVQAFNDTATATFAVDEARADFGVDGDADGSPGGYSAGDIVIAVIDTGISPNHLDLQGKIIGWKDYINNQPAPYDDQGHGTHVAATAAGTGAALGDKRYQGVAPGAALVGVKVLDSTGNGTDTQVNNGLQWVIDNKLALGIEILSMSLGTAGCSDGSDSISQLVNQAVAAGIVAVVAAGNSGPVSCSVGSPGAAVNAITVGAVADPAEMGVNLTSFSSRGPTVDGRIKPDILAPGLNIMSASNTSSTGYTEKSGTSMSTPFVSGVVALMLDATPGLTPSQIKGFLASTADEWGAAGPDNESGYGLIDPHEAINAVSAANPTKETLLPPRFQVSGTLNGKDDYDLIPINVSSTSAPISITMTILDTSSYDFLADLFGCVQPDFELFLYAPGVNPVNGNPVASAEGCARHEELGYMPSSTGAYTLKVYSVDDSTTFPTFNDWSGPYVLDISGGTGTASTPTPTPTPIATPGASSLYVWDIAFLSSQQGSNHRERIQVRIKRDLTGNGPDAGDSNVSGVTVTVQLFNATTNAPLGNAYVGTTNSQGIYRTAQITLPAGSYRAEVTALTHGAYSWNRDLDPVSLNGDSDADGDNFPDQSHTIPH